MGRQLSMRMMPEDLRDLESLLIERGAQFIGYYHAGQRLEVRSTIDLEENREPITWLARKDDLGHVRIRQVPEQGYWLVDQVLSPVIELSRGGWDGHALRRGRLHMNTSYYDENNRKTPFPSDFLEWAQGIFTAVRQRFVRDPRSGTYDGPHARDWLQLHGAEVP